jgi:hypothetical protein
MDRAMNAPDERLAVTDPGTDIDCPPERSDPARLDDFPVLVDRATHRAAAHLERSDPATAAYWRTR